MHVKVCIHVHVYLCTCTLCIVCTVKYAAAKLHHMSVVEVARSVKYFCQQAAPKDSRHWLSTPSLIVSKQADGGRTSRLGIRSCQEANGQGMNYTHKHTPSTVLNFQEKGNL